MQPTLFRPQDRREDMTYVIFSHTPKYYFTNTMYSNFPTVIRLWNTLPATVVGSLNLEQFTRDITEIRLTP